MATTKNITVAGSGLIASVNTPTIRVTYDKSDITATGNQYGIQAIEPTEVVIDVQALNLGGGQAPDRSMDIGLNGDLIQYSILFNSPRINITGHTAVASDSYKYFGIGKGFSEPQTVSEQLAKSLSNSKRDTAYANEYFSVNLNKKFADNFINTDKISLAPNKGALDIFASTDASKVSVEKIFFEQKYTSDRVALVANFRRQFDDTVDSTDDFYGETNLDDDQTARVGKSIVDYVSQTDVNSFELYLTKLERHYAIDTSSILIAKPFYNTITNSDVVNTSSIKNVVELSSLTDVKQGHVSKVALDTSTSIDQSTLSLAKPFIDAIGSTDNAYISSNKLVSDPIVTNDNFSYSWEVRRALAEQFNSSDVATTDIATTKADQVSAMDVIKLVLGRLVYLADSIGHSDSSYTQVSYNRLFEDYVSTTDDFYGQANLDDDQIASVIKGVIEYAVTSDILSFDATKLLSTQYVVPDTTSFSLTKPLTDTFGKSDLVSLEPIKGVTEVIPTADIAEKASSKYLLDILLSNDILAKLVSKAETDILSTNDTIKSFVANKNTVDHSNTLDIISFNARSIRNDIASIQNPIALNNTKQLLDTSTNSDTKYLQAYKTQIDLLGLKNADSASKASAKVLIDVSSSIDIPKNTFSTPKSDSVGITETKIQLVTNYYRTYLDSIDATDDFYGAANVDDDQTARLGKNIVDYIATLDPKSVHITAVRQDTALNTDTPYKQNKKIASDVFTASDVFSFNKVTDRDLADVRNVSDSVYINWQDYCEPNIFEPTYIGQERFLSYN